MKILLASLMSLILFSSELNAAHWMHKDLSGSTIDVEVENQSSYTARYVLTYNSSSEGGAQEVTVTDQRPGWAKTFHLPSDAQYTKLEAYFMKFDKTEIKIDRYLGNSAGKLLFSRSGPNFEGVSQKWEQASYNYNQGNSDGSSYNPVNSFDVTQQKADEAARPKAGTITVHNQMGHTKVFQVKVGYDLDGKREHIREDDIDGGQTRTIDLPGGATNIKIKCEEETFKRDVFYFEYEEVVDKHFEVYGKGKFGVGFMER